MNYAQFESVFNTFKYPAGEIHVDLKPNAETHDLECIEVDARSFDDLCKCVVGNEVLQRHGINVQWFIPYFPFARHDRRFHHDDGQELILALVLARLINTVIADPHSDVSATLPFFPQSEVVKLFRAAGAFANEPLIVIPDAGATKKAMEWIGKDELYVQGIKHRDPSTGKLSCFEINPAAHVEGRNCIIIDDICDGGGTFLGLADKLKEAGAESLTLAVTHGLFTKGTKELASKFSKIIAMGRGETNELVSRIPFRSLYRSGRRL